MNMRDDDSIGLQDFSSIIVATAKSNRCLRFNTSTTSDITFDSSNELDESWSLEEEDQSDYADYHRMLTAADNKKSIKSGKPPKPLSQVPKRSRWRLYRGQFSRALKEPLNLSCQPPVVPKRLPFMDDSFVTQQTASMNSLGSEGLRWLVIGKEWTGEEIKKRDRVMTIPKRLDSMEDIHPCVRRAGTRPEKTPQHSTTSKYSPPRAQLASSLVEI